MGLLGEVKEDSVRFTDAEVCRSYLKGLCPYELFRNTKLDLGTCNKIHSPALKADFEIASKKRDYEFYLDQLDQLSTFIRDCDRKVEQNRQRLVDTQDEKDLSDEAAAVHGLNEQIGKKLAEIEELGAEGKVDESMALMKELEELKQEKRKAEETYRNTIPASATQQQKLRVCEVCAAYLSLYDNDRRLADHFGGKLHMGFIKIRNRCKELEDEAKEKAEEKRKERESGRNRGRYDEGSRSDSRRSRDRHRSRSRSRSRSRERSGNSSRDRYRSSRDDRDRMNRDRRDRGRSSRSSRYSRSRSRSRSR